jgi:type II secretory pathway pseudopilin PulG
MIKRCSPIININDKRPLFLKVKERQSGAALLYIFMAIALMAILTASLINTSSTSSRPQQAQRLAATLESQITYIRSAILECVQSYPAGDPTINSGSTTDTGYNNPYPVRPESNHFNGSTLGQASDNNVNELRCPGNPGIDNNHTPLFKGVGGRFAPVLPDTLGDKWGYSNITFTLNGKLLDGVFIGFSTDKTDAYIKDAMQIVASNYDSCQAEYIVGNGSNGCLSGRVCLYYWLKRNSGC